MGGTGLLIYGTLAPERLVPRPLPRTLFDRLLGQTRHVAPKVTPHGGGGERIQLDAAELVPLIPRFRDFLARKLSQPNEASRQVLEYLELKNIPSLYLRGEREPGHEPEWYTGRAARARARHFHAVRVRTDPGADVRGARPIPAGRGAGLSAIRSRGRAGRGWARLRGGLRHAGRGGGGRPTGRRCKRPPRRPDGRWALPLSALRAGRRAPQLGGQRSSGCAGRNSRSNARNSVLDKG